MAIFVHLTPEKNSNRIRQVGIKTTKGGDGYPDGVYAQAVTQNFFVSHQWLRELKRSGQRTICGVYFRIPDSEMVWVGHYNQEHIQTTAAKASGIIHHHKSPLGYQIYIPRKIEKREIIRIRHLPQNIGWRYYPEAHGNKPCGCPVCIPRGEIKSRRIRKQWQAENE